MENLFFERHSPIFIYSLLYFISTTLYFKYIFRFIAFYTVMIIANQLRTKNRAEYLLYMWQVEDILRAYKLDIDLIKSQYLSQFNLEGDTLKQTEEWYANLCEMMKNEGVAEHGHLQINKNVLQELEELHSQLMNSQKFPYYHEMYYKVLAYIVELRAKGASKEDSELQICFDALYGILILRLQHKEITADTEKARKDISTFLGQLSDYYFKDKQEPIEF